MPAAKPFVFVSHASSNKPQVKPIVDALLAAGLRVFVDNPQEMGYRGDELLKFDSLHAGQGDYTHQLAAYVRSAGCVLACLSSATSTASSEWLRELIIGEENQTLVSCRIERFDFAKLGTRWNAQHALNVLPDESGTIPPGRLDALVRDVRLKLGLGGGITSTGPRSDYLTYLVDRDMQEAAFQSLARTVRREHGVRPVLFAGPRNELTDGFLARLGSAACTIFEHAWKQYLVSWPYGCALDEFDIAYRSLLAKEMEAFDETDAGLSRSLIDNNRPVALIHNLSAEAWDVHDGARLKAWLSFWRRMATSLTGVSVVPLIQLDFPPAQPGWQRNADQNAQLECPPDGFLLSLTRRVSNRRIWESVCKLSTMSDGSSGGLTVLRMLPPILPHEADNWVRRLGGQYPSPPLQLAVNGLFSSRRAKQHGVNHETFSKALVPVLDGVTTARAE
jgi:hypothetical protein